MSCPGNSPGDVLGLVAANDWAQRVVNNGGARPSSTSISAVENFYAALIAAGIDSKMHAVNVMAPDNLTAARTPLIKKLGADPWGNSNMIDGYLTVNGLLGNGINAYLNSTINPSLEASVNIASVGVSLYVYSHTASGASSGCYDNVLGRGCFISTGVCDIWNNTTERVVHGVGDKDGFYLGTRIAANDLRVFFANSTNAWAQYGATVVAGGSPKVNAQFTTHSISGQFPNDSRMSFAAFHSGLTSTEGQALYNAVQALRTAFGGGFV